MQGRRPPHQHHRCSVGTRPAVWGRGIWVCLYCDAYEYTRQPMGAYGNGERGVHIAFEVGSRETA